jgi:hypothetical protein
MTRKEHGYTLVELIVVMAIFIVVMIITGSAFNALLSSSTKTSKSVETQITDIIGLEVLRFDIKHAGYGLTYFFPTAIVYNEAENVPNDPVPGINAANYNDASNPPRPFRLGNNVGVNGSDYLVVKSTMVSGSATAAKWNYVTTGGAPKVWDEAAKNLINGEGVIVVDPAPNADPDEQRQLVVTGGVYGAEVGVDLPSFYPTESDQSYLIFGVDSGAALKMPFNRADYYIRRPADISQRCAPGTGILYKSVLSQVANENFSDIPLFDCVGDIQVVFSLATNAPVDNSINSHVDGTGNNVEGLTLYQLASRVKEVRLYILTHEGRSDMTYSFPANPINVGEDFGAGVLGRTWTTANMAAIFGANWQNYRWKVYTLVVIPNNL